MRVPKNITVRWLERRKACSKQVAQFNQEWPKGAALTRENLRRAVHLDLDIWWVTPELLSETQYEELDSVTDLAWARYYRGPHTTRRHINYYLKVADALADALKLP